MEIISYNMTYEQHLLLMMYQAFEDVDNDVVAEVRKYLKEKGLV